MKQFFLKNESGISLNVLVITVVIMIILTASVIVNFQQYGEQVKMSHFSEDITMLNEEITQYYSRNKELPIRNIFTNVSSIASVKNPNDGADYYIIDLDKLNVKLNYGKNYDNIKLTTSISDVIATLEDVYIINGQSHTVYYPKGLEINGTIYYKLLEEFTAVSGKTEIIIPPTAKENLSYTGEAQELINAGTTNVGTMQYKVNDGEYGTSIPTATDAGTYNVYYKAVGSNNHNTETGPVEVTIGKVTPNVTAPVAKSNLSYTGNAQELITAGSTTGGTIQYKVNNGTYSTSVPTATDVGTYTIYYKVIGDANYEDVAEASVTSTVKYKITYNSNGGSGNMSETTGISVTIADNGFAAPSGKEFVGWNTASNGTGTSYTAGVTVNSNLILYAQWRNQRFYLFNNGDECTSLTGGWDFTYPGYVDSPSWSKVDNNKTLYSGLLTTINSSHGNAIVTNNSVDLTNYSKICLSMEIRADSYTAGSCYGFINFGTPKATGWADSKRWNCSVLGRWFRENPNFGSDVRTYEFDIDPQERKSVYIYIVANNNPQDGAPYGTTITNEELFVHEIWLEK